jgi:hypothetical protein
MNKDREIFIIHSNIDKKSIIIDNQILFIITFFLLFLVIMNI